MTTANPTQTQEITITVRLDKNVANTFKDLAKSNHRNQSSLIREFIESYIRSHKQTKLKI